MGNRKHPKRKNIRLKHYDYSQPGFYFVTVCTQNKIKLFGEIKKGEMILNKAGKMVKKIWLEIPKIFAHTKLHEYIIMPNHFHAIIEITPQIHVVGAESISARKNNAQVDMESANNKRADMESAPTRENNVSLPKIIQTFKRYYTIEYIKMVKQGLLPPFDKKLWQRNHYEHVIRNEQSYSKIAEYIINNPLKWEDDKYYA
ncbi:transposase [Deferribacter abyssi]|uniref:transposase n=1 Tax=Deferribacter abyssi TaxID=213806 RepID=UPI003C177647